MTRYDVHVYVQWLGFINMYMYLDVHVHVLGCTCTCTWMYMYLDVQLYLYIYLDVVNNGYIHVLRCNKIMTR